MHIPSTSLLVVTVFGQHILHQQIYPFVGQLYLGSSDTYLNHACNNLLYAYVFLVFL